MLAWKRAEARRVAATIAGEMRVISAEVQRLSERVAQLVEQLAAIQGLAD